MTTVAGFVPVRLDALRVLGEPTGRREAHHLAALRVGVGLAEAVDWQTNTLASFSAVGFAARQKMSWSRCRRALDRLAASGAAQTSLHGFRGGVASVTPREDRASLLHDRSRTSERFVALSRGALDAIAEEHGLSWVATALLLALLLLCDHRTAELGDNWTKSRLSAKWGIGWRRLSAGLAELEAAGLIALEVHRGRAMRLRLVARPALVALPTPLHSAPATRTAPTTNSAAPGPPRRRERRDITREARHGGGPAGDLARRLLGHHQIEGEPSVALLSSLSDSLGAGGAPEVILERLVARGSLRGAHDDMAVLVTRARQVTAEIAAAARDDEQRRADAARVGREHETARQTDAARRAHLDDEDRWLAAVLDKLPRGAALGLSPLVATRPVAVAVAIHDACAELVGKWPEFDPVDLVRRWSQQPLPLPEIDVTGIGHRRTDHGPRGTLPRARAGPTLVERLRAVTS